MHYEKGLATQDHAGESWACAAANAMNHAIKNARPNLTFEEVVQAIENGYDLEIETGVEWWGDYLVEPPFFPLNSGNSSVVIKNGWGEMLPSGPMMSDGIYKDPEVLT